MTQEARAIQGNRDSGIGEFLLVESGIGGFEIGDSSQGIRSPTIHWNLESKFH